MKIQTYLFSFALLISSGSHVFGAVGYCNIGFEPGDNLFHNQLDFSPNTLSALFPSAPNGTVISLWNPATSSFDSSSIFSTGSWSVNLVLQPGTGALLNTHSSFTNTFVGTLVNHDGSPYQGTPIFPPVFSGPDGVYLSGDKLYGTDTGTDIFMNIFGRLPNPGEQITFLDGATQTYSVSTYSGNGVWDLFPILKPGQAAFFNIKSVPEPSNLIFLFLCISLFEICRKRAAIR